MQLGKKKKDSVRGCYLTDAVEAGGIDNTLRDWRKNTTMGGWE